VNLRFALPGTEQMLQIDGRVIWATSDACGVRFRYIPESQRTVLEQWLTECVERSISRVCERVRQACSPQRSQGNTERRKARFRGPFL
jgi:hypothetical protein